MKRTTWTLIFAGLLAAGMGLHLIVTQPLHRQICALTSEVDDLQSGMRQLADYRDEVAGTNDLLSGLEAQSRRIDLARAAMEKMRQLEREVFVQSDTADDALAALSNMTRLQSQVIAQSERVSAMQVSLDQIGEYQQRAGHLADASEQLLVDIDLAEESLRQLGDFHQRVAIESSGIEIAKNRFARLIDLKQNIEQVQPATIDAAQLRLAELDSLTQQVINDGQQAEQAREITGRMIALQDDVISRGTRVDAARQHAEQLLNLEELLANDAGRDIDAATHNLASLLQMEEQLAAQDQRIAAAIESLELLQDLQSEFVERTRNLENMRRGLTELIMMESMVARTVRSLQPLTELTDLRRLDTSQLHLIARSMTAGSGQRIATSRDDSPAVSTPSARQDIEFPSSDEPLVPVPPVD